MPKNQITTDFIYLVSSNFVTISHINYWDQVNSWKNLLKFWNGPLCRNKSGTFPQLNVTVYWKSSATEACAKKLSQILANNNENGGRGIGLRIYMRYCKLYYCLLLLRMILHLHMWAVAWHENKFFSELDKTTIHELWKLIAFLIFKTSLAITPHPPASLWRITYENRYVTHL